MNNESIFINIDKISFEIANKKIKTKGFATHISHVAIKNLNVLEIY